MRRLVVAATCGSLLLLVRPASPIAAQTAPTTAAAVVPRPANDSLFRYARRLVAEGNGAAGRALVDSLLNDAPPNTPAYGNALYWHGALAATAAEAERDYRRVIVEFPLAYYADDALLAIAELEQARGDRVGALAHLQRFVHEHPASPARGIAALGAARLAFEQRDTKTGCAMITEARAAVAPGDVEVSNQIAYYAGRCPSLPPTVAKLGSVTRPSTDSVTIEKREAKSDSARAPIPAAPPAVPVTPVPITSPRVTVVTTPTPAVRAPEPRRAEPAPPRAAVSSATAGRYTIQLAAYNTRAEAERLVGTLAARGVTARVSGDAKPFRVRLGFYRTHADAAAEVASLKSRGIISFVAVEDPPARGATRP
jgi:cell division protein FtsN